MIKKKKKVKRNKVGKTRKQQLDKSCNGGVEEALVTTLLAECGIFAAFLVQFFFNGNDAVGKLFEPQPLLESVVNLYTSLIAVIGVAYSKFGKSIFVSQGVYWRSLFSYIVITVIFIQVRSWADPTNSNWFESPCFFLVLHLMLAVQIYKIARQPVIGTVRVVYREQKFK